VRLHLPTTKLGGMWDCPVVVAARRGDTVPAYNLLSQTKGSRPLLLNVSVIVVPVSEHALATIHLFRDMASHWL